MFRDRAQDALLIAAAPTLKRIGRHRKRVPERLEKLLAYLEIGENLFHPDLNATEAWKKARIRDHSLTTVFRDFTGRSLAVYITEARIEVAKRMLQSTDLAIGKIGRAVGYSYHRTFLNAYRRVESKKPSEEPRRPASARIGGTAHGQCAPEAARGSSGEQPLGTWPDPEEEAGARSFRQ